MLLCSSAVLQGFSILFQKMPCSIGHLRLEMLGHNEGYRMRTLKRNRVPEPTP